MYIMPYKEHLELELQCGLMDIGLPLGEATLTVRPYSKCYYGKYLPAKNSVPARIFIYPYENEEGKMYPFSDIFRTAIHERVHHAQYLDPSFKRVRGVMHNEQFWELYNHYVNIAAGKGIITL